jgi:hypothetical protein
MNLSPEVVPIVIKSQGSQQQLVAIRNAIVLPRIDFSIDILVLEINQKFL